MYNVKEKKERALGEHLHLKGYRCQSPKCAAVRRPYRPGVQGKKRQRSISDFARQLKEKQKFKLSYGLADKKLRNIFQEAKRSKASSVEKLAELVERRLDNVVFRLGLAPSRSDARQKIVHGHIIVNGQRVRSPGFRVRMNDLIGVRSESLGKTAFKNSRETLKTYEPPAWLALDPEKLEGRVIDLPKDTGLPVEIGLLVESFNK